MRRLPLLMAAAVLGGLVSIAPAAADTFEDELVAELTANGFLVTGGYAKLYTANDCDLYTYPATRNCYGNNPAAPYVVPVVRAWPDEYVDPATVDAFVDTPPGYSATYRLDPREAIVIYGELPPPGTYFGLQSFVFSQDGTWKARDYDEYARTPNLVLPMQYLFGTLPPADAKSKRIQSLSSISNIINNVIVERQSGSAFGQTRYFVITPDRSMDRAVRRALSGLGVPDAHVFTEPIPGRDDRGLIGPLGMGRHAIDFLTVIRYALPDPGFEEAARQWRNAPPLTVLRVRATRGAKEPYPSLVLEPRTAVDEVGDAALTVGLNSLISAVCGRASGAPWNLEGIGCADPPEDESIMKDLPALGWTGPYCREVGMNCQGDQQDASYFFAPARPLDSGEIYAVAGTLATKTGNATYAALSVNDASRLKGAANLLHTQLEGSAAAYAAVVPNHDMFFLHYFARDCDAILDLTDGRCTEVSEGVVPRAGDPTAQGDPALLGKFLAALRAYIVPGTARGPVSSRQLAPRLLTFTHQ